jgi:cytochrome P450
MAVDQFLLALLLFSFGLLLFFITRNRSNRPYQGPTIYPVIGILWEFFKNRDRFLEWTTDVLSRTPSQTFMIQRPGGVRGIITANPSNVEHILRANFQNYPKGERFSFLLHDFLGRGIFNTDGELWKMQRKAASYEFNTKSLRNFVVEAVQWEIKNRLMAVLKNACERGEIIDLQDVLMRFAFDNICKVAFGVDPGCLHPSLPRSQFAEAFNDATDISAGRFFSVVPFLWRIKKMLDIGSEKRLREAISVVDEFVMDIIRSRRSEISEGHLREDLLSRFMAAAISDLDQLETECDKNGSQNMAMVSEKSELFVRDMMVSFMMAGRDTTSSALTWFFWLISSRPHIQEAIRREILLVKGNRNSITVEPEDQWVVFDFDELKGMQYLHAALCESMRLWPPVSVDTKVAATDDVFPDGTVVPRGWFVSYSIYSMGRMESIWGGDFMDFRPERWLKDGEFVGENPYKFTVFQAGPRICLGKEMAFIQMKSIVASVIHRFSLEVDSEYVPKYAMSITLRMKTGLPVNVKSR